MDWIPKLDFQLLLFYQLLDNDPNRSIMRNHNFAEIGSNSKNWKLHQKVKTLTASDFINLVGILLVD
jgi:hypothetical protein